MPAAARRRPPPEEPRTGGSYFAGPKEDLKFVRSGSSLLDCALGGGWTLGRMANIVGDKSTGKTLLAIEASANFARAYPQGQLFFRERESAFDKNYAEAMGMPLRRVDFGKQRFDTVEGFEQDLHACIQKCKEKRQPGIYILDSMDALSDEAELKKKAGEGSYGTAKAKANSELFRKLVRPMEDAQLLLIIISQIRDKINAMFGKKWTRAGGHALDFYATHVVELAHLGYIKKTRNKVERAIGVDIKANVSKNKVGLTNRQARFDIKFGYGIDDLTSCMDWLIEVEKLPALNITDADAGPKMKAQAADWLFETLHMTDDVEYAQRVAHVTTTTAAVWREIEEGFLPKRKKYG